jgi:hypothetical protein
MLDLEENHIDVSSLQQTLDMSYSEDEMAFASKAVFIEMRLRQALACSASIGVPNQFRYWSQNQLY